jgi:hypothetical protein
MSPSNKSEPGAPSQRIYYRGLVGLANFMRLSLELSTALPTRGEWNGLRQEVQPTSGCPILRILRRVGSTNLDTKVRVSHPLQRTQRMGHPEIHGPSYLPKHEARTCFFSESRMKFVDATNLDRKSGVPGRKMNCFECSHQIARPSLRVQEPFPLPAREKAFVGGFAPSYSAHVLRISCRGCWRWRTSCGFP